MKTYSKHTLWFIASLVVLAACKEGDDATESDYDDVAAGVGALVADGSGGGEVGMMARATDAAKGTPPAGLTASGTGTWTGVFGGLEFSFAVDCLDSDGEPLELTEDFTCPDTTNAASLSIDASGAWEGPRRSASLEYQGAWSATDLQDEIATFEGGATARAEGDFMALYYEDVRTWKFDYEGEHEGVRFRTSDRTPVGGTSRYTVRAERTRKTARRSVEASFDIEAVVTYHEDGTATIVLDGDRTYNLDIGSGNVTKE